MRKTILLCLLLGGCDLWDAVIVGQEGEAAGKSEETPEAPDADSGTPDVDDESVRFAPVCDDEGTVTPHPLVAERCKADVAAIVNDGTQFFTIQEAIDETSGTVYVCPGVHTERISSATSDTVSLAAASGSAEDTILDGEGDRILSVMSDVVLYNLTIQNGGDQDANVPTVSAEGGVEIGCAVFVGNHDAIRAFNPSETSHTLTIQGSEFSSGTGSALWFAGGDSTVEDSTFSNHRSSSKEMVYVLGENISLTQVRFTSNTALHGVYFVGQTVDIESLTFDGNQSEQTIFDIKGEAVNLKKVSFQDNVGEWGSRVYAEDTLNINTLAFEDNIFESTGLDVDGETIRVNDLTFKDNTFRSTGLDVDGETINIDTLTFEDNTGYNWNEIRLDSASTTITSASIQNNQSPQGFLVYIPSEEINLQNISLEGNTAQYDVLHAIGNTHIEAATFANNQSTGAHFSIVDVSGGRITVEGTSFLGNQASRSGAIHAFIQDEGSIFSLKDSALIGNTSDQSGALSLMGGAPATIEDVTIAENVAEKVGGIDASSFHGATLHLERVQLNNNRNQNDRDCGALSVAFNSLILVDSLITGNAGSAAVCLNTASIRSENTGWGTTDGGDDNENADLASQCGTLTNLGTAETFSCVDGVLRR